MSYLIRAPLRSGELAAFNPAHVDVIISAETGADLFVKGRRLECEHDLHHLRLVLERAGRFFVVVTAPKSVMAFSRDQIASVEQTRQGLMFHLANGQKVSAPGDLVDFLAQMAAQTGAPEIHFG